MLIKGFLIRGSEKYRSSRILLMTTQPELWTPFVRNLFCTSLHQLCLIFIQTNCTFSSLQQFSLFTIPTMLWNPFTLIIFGGEIGKIHQNSSWMCPSSPLFVSFCTALYTHQIKVLSFVLAAKAQELPCFSPPNKLLNTRTRNKQILGTEIVCQKHNRYI